MWSEDRFQQDVGWDKHTPPSSTTNTGTKADPVDVAPPGGEGDYLLTLGIQEGVANLAVRGNTDPHTVALAQM